MKADLRAFFGALLVGVALGWWGHVRYVERSIATLQAQADSLRDVVRADSLRYADSIRLYAERVATARGRTDSIIVTLPPVVAVFPRDTSQIVPHFSDSVECFRVGAIAAWRDSLQNAITAERQAADRQFAISTARIIELNHAVATYQLRLDEVIAASRPRHGWKTDAALLGMGLVAGLLLK